MNTQGNLAGFNAADVAPNDGFDVLPAGEYDVAIVASSVETTKKGDGRFLKLELQVLNGPYQNRRCFDRLNLWNPNAQAVQIAQGTLSSICRSVGVLTPRDSSDLHNKPLRVKLVVKKSDEYGESNEVKRYSSRNAGGPGLGPAVTAAVAVPGFNQSPPAASPWPMSTGTPQADYAPEQLPF